MAISRKRIAAIHAEEEKRWFAEWEGRHARQSDTWMELARQVCSEETIWRLDSHIAAFWELAVKDPKSPEVTAILEVAERLSDSLWPEHEDVVRWAEYAERYGKASPHDTPDFNSWPNRLPVPPDDPTPFVTVTVKAFAEAAPETPDAHAWAFITWELAGALVTWQDTLTAT